MATVYLCSPTNSTTFTTCCRVAICDNQDNCPSCGEEILPKGRARFSHAFRTSPNGGCPAWKRKPGGSQ